jgi:hypothetical protein
VLSPLRKIRHGLWRFSVAGAEGTNGQEMTIDVRYAGESLGVKTLSIGNDIWSPDEPVGAVGGCSIEVAPRRAGGWSWLAAAGIAAVISARAARRRR